jgi:hypothetical protein
MAPAGQSHWGVATDAYRALHLQEQIEELYTTQEDNQLYEAAWKKWMDFHRRGSRYDTRQGEFDRVDYQRINNSLGCILDYNNQDA